MLLRVRLAEGYPVAALDPSVRAALAGHEARGLLDPAALAAGTVRLTRDGRLLADAVVRDLVS